MSNLTTSERDVFCQALLATVNRGRNGFLHGLQSQHLNDNLAVTKMCANGAEADVILQRLPAMHATLQEDPLAPFRLAAAAVQPTDGGDEDQTAQEDILGPLLEVQHSGTIRSESTAQAGLIKCSGSLHE